MRDARSPGEMCRVEVAGVGVCLARLADGSVHAVADLCTHEDELLSEGYLDGDFIEWPRPRLPVCSALRR
ncbi:MAG TPA: Rieske 2Fe-2S domain-containing protein, partial [Gemmatimonadales bacterium]|nr:Rieske 2Fe-2S domain-containing protein [Gemmatimonadales bacterium]